MIHACLRSDRQRQREGASSNGLDAPVAHFPLVKNEAMLFFKGCDHVGAVVQVAQWDPLVGFTPVAFPCYQELVLSTVESILQNFFHLVLFLAVDNGGVWGRWDSRAKCFRRWQVVPEGVDMEDIVDLVEWG